MYRTGGCHDLLTLVAVLLVHTVAAAQPLLHLVAPLDGHRYETSAGYVLQPSPLQGNTGLADVSTWPAEVPHPWGTTSHPWSTTSRTRKAAPLTDLLARAAAFTAALGWTCLFTTKCTTSTSVETARCAGVSSGNDCLTLHHLTSGDDSFRGAP